jgi:hypothetical protein
MTNVCRGIEPGFYEAGKAKEISEIEARADRVLSFDADLKCDLGLGKVQDEIRDPIRLSRDEVEAFLKSERHKTILIAWCDKTIMWNDEKKEQLFLEVKSFTAKLGYSRVVVLGAHAFGVHVIVDTKPDSPNRPANGSQPVHPETNSTSSAAGSRR